MNNEDEIVAIYLAGVANGKPLTREEESELFQQLGAKGDWDEQQENAARKLIENQLGVVVKIAKSRRSSGISLLELIQEGNIGLMSAIKSFAENPHGDFTAYAAACIENAISNFRLQRQGSINSFGI